MGDVAHALDPIEIVRRMCVEAGRRVKIEDLAGAATVLKRAGRELRGGCPLCGAGGKGSTIFAVKPEKGSFVCYGCGAAGDVVDLERALRGGSMAEAARRLIGEGWKGEATAIAPKPKPEPPKGPSASERIAAELWREGRPILGTLAERYLLRRGIAPEIVALAAPSLRFHPFAKWSWDGEWIKHPALLAEVATAEGPTGGVHATYLARDGSGKAALKPAKRMWGVHSRGGRPGGTWLIGPGAPTGTPLVIGEGIETALSVVTLLGRPVRACAALSLNRLQGGLQRDDDGCVDFDDPQPNPDTPAFTWPAPADGPWDVWLAVDRDMSPIKLKSRTGRGKIIDFELNAEARARLCVRLARRQWLAAGARRVRPIGPPPGSDFNDELRRVMAQRSGGAR